MPPVPVRDIFHQANPAWQVGNHVGTEVHHLAGGEGAAAKEHRQQLFFLAGAGLQLFIQGPYTHITHVALDDDDFQNRLDVLGAHTGFDLALPSGGHRDVAVALDPAVPHAPGFSSRAVLEFSDVGQAATAGGGKQGDRHGQPHRKAFQKEHEESSVSVCNGVEACIVHRSQPPTPPTVPMHTK
jgi:hypothetical protein